MFQKLRNKNFSPIIIVVVLVLAVLAVANAIRIGKDEGRNRNNGTVQPAVSDEYPLAVTYLDVGQGDGIVICCKDIVIVVDGGEREEAQTVVAYLQRAGISTVDCYIATHPHSDHIGAAAGVFGAMNVKSVMMTEFSEINMPTTEVYASLLTSIENEGCEIIVPTAGESYTFGDLTLTVFAPVQETGDYNNMSIVFKMTYGKTSYLFTGDAAAESEQLMLDAGFDLSADVLKVGHHGSANSTTEAFFDAVSPRLAIISCGHNNDYGHPHKEILTMLETAEVPYYRTDLNGDITVFSDGKNIFIKAL